MNQQEPAAPAPTPSHAAGAAETPAQAAVGVALSAYVAALELVAEHDGPEHAIAAAARAIRVLAQAQLQLGTHTTRSVTSALRIVVDDDPTTPA